MFTQSRNLKPNHSNALPQRILFLDTETIGERQGKVEYHKMYMAWTAYCRYERGQGFRERKWEYHESPRKLCEYISTCVPERTSLYVFAHNAFFDVQASGFFKYFSEMGWNLSFFYEAGLSYILSIRSGRRSIKVVSTTNWFATSLKKLGDYVELPKMEVDFDKDSPEYVSAYCKRDVEILVKAVEKYIGFLEIHDLGKFSLTRASQAFHAYRHRFMNEVIGLHDEDEIIELERAAYMGGRTEAHYIGKHHASDFVSLDINSMYPYVMKTYPMPRELIDYIENPTLDECRALLNHYCVVCEAEIDTDEPAYAYRTEAKIIFPVGKFTAYLTTASLEYGLEHGHVKEVKRIAIYNRGDLFSEYIDYFYSLRSQYKNEGNEIYNQLCKYFMNSLYGKFGQKEPIEEKSHVIAPNLYIRHEIIDTVTGERETETILCNTRIVAKGEREGKQSFVAIPAHITDYGRIMLWRMIKRIGYENALYCDTDSIKCESRYVDRLDDVLDDNELGMLKVEERFDSFTIHGCKDYETENVIKLKGVPRTATLNPDGSYTYSTFLSQASHLRMQEFDRYVIRDTTKMNKRIYDKGIVNPDGYVSPHRLIPGVPCPV